MHDITLKMSDLQEGYIPVKGLYDFIRLVDPFNKKVEQNIYPQMQEGNIYETTCFHFWNQGRICENCISARACNEGASFVKIEYNGTRLFLISAACIVIDGEQRVLEMLKDITENGLLDIKEKQTYEIYQMVNKINDLIVKDSLTGIFNNQYALERLPQAILENRTTAKKISIMVVRLNNLETIRSSFGYIEADQAIIDLSFKLSDYCQTTDNAWVARLGESEFLLVLPDCSDEEAKQLEGRIYQQLNSELITFGKNQVRIEVSIGLHMIEGQEFFADDLANLAIMAITAARDQAKVKMNNQLSDGFMENGLLSLREREVAKQVLEGKTNEEIAKALYISVTTVKKHISSIYQKAGVNSRSSFMALYQNYKSGI